MGLIKRVSLPVIQRRPAKIEIVRNPKIPVSMLDHTVWVSPEGAAYRLKIVHAPYADLGAQKVLNCWTFRPHYTKEESERLLTQRRIPLPSIDFREFMHGIATPLSVFQANIGMIARGISFSPSDPRFERLNRAKETLKIVEDCIWHNRTIFEENLPKRQNIVNALYGINVQNVPPEILYSSAKSEFGTRLNLGLINHIRKMAKLPEIQEGKRPATVHSLLLIDDKADLLATVAETLGYVPNRRIVTLSELLDYPELTSEQMPGMLIVTAQTPEEITAVERAVLAYSFDMVLADHDYEIPSSTLCGSKLVAGLRINGAQCVFVGMTGDLDNISKFYGTGADAVLMKPVPQDVLMALII